MGMLDDLQTLNIGDIVIFKASRLDNVYDHGKQVQVNLQDAETVLSIDGISEFCLISVPTSPPHTTCLHCLPAQRGFRVRCCCTTGAEILDGPRS